MEKTHEERMGEWKELIDDLHKCEYEGIVPSPPDPRDYDVSDIVSFAPIPSKFQLDPSPIILDQGQTPYCGGASGAGMANAYYNSYNQMPDKGFSMTFLYWLAKEYDGIPHINGTYIRTILKVMQKYGCATKEVFPYSSSRVNITVGAVEDAQNYQIESYARLRTPYDIRLAISRGMYVIIGTLVTRDNWRRTYLSFPSGTLYGGHATHLFGYDDDLQEAHVGYYFGQNSWGASRHANGRFFLPYDYHRMTIEGRPAFLEAWGVQFKAIEEGSKKKEELYRPTQPTFPTIVRPSIDIQAIRDRIDEIRRNLQQLFRR